MHLVRPTTNCRNYLFIFIFGSIFSTALRAQENSPYSRYGLGNMLPQQNILNRAMGGISLPYYDLQSVNFSNPASYAYLRVTTLDLGLDYTARTIRENDRPEKFTSRYLIPSYVQLGLPLKKKGNWGMNIGFRPVSRINYLLEQNTRITGIDSVRYNYQGGGGTYNVYLGTGFGNRRFSVGVNAGWLWGNKGYSTQVILLNDTVPYKKSNSSDTTSFGGLFFQGGAMYRAELGQRMFLRLGVNGNLQTTLKGKRDIVRETFEFNGSGGVDVLDSVYRASEQPGDVIYPATFGFGVMLEKEEKWLVGAEFNHAAWSNYRYYGESDPLRNNWTIRFGGQFMPDVNGKNYWSRVVYRAGFSFGPDYIDISQDLNQYMFSIGASFPVRRSYYTNQYTSINTAFEFGARGNKDNTLRESLFRVSFGFNLSDVWFNPRKYD